jgi:hypothetical protein
MDNLEEAVANLIKALEKAEAGSPGGSGSGLAAVVRHLFGPLRMTTTADGLASVREGRVAAATALGQIATLAKGAVPSVIEAMKDRNGDVPPESAVALMNVVDAIANIGRDAVAALLTAFGQRNILRSNDIFDILEREECGTFAIPALVTALQVRNPNARWFAARILGRLERVMNSTKNGERLCEASGCRRRRSAAPPGYC